MNNILILDVETLISNKGNPFDITNKCVCVGLKYTNVEACIWYNEEAKVIQPIINNASLIVGFNLKFDLHWLRRIGIDISKIKVWDCQLAEFLLNNQQTKYPSLDQAAEKYSLPKKLDVVKSEYWDKGIDTDMVPREVLSEYLTQDLVLTQQVFEIQRKQFGV